MDATDRPTTQVREGSLPADIRRMLDNGWFAVVRDRQFGSLAQVVGLFPTRSRAESLVNSIYADQFDSCNAPLFSVVGVGDIPTEDILR